MGKDNRKAGIWGYVISALGGFIIGFVISYLIPSDIKQGELVRPQKQATGISNRLSRSLTLFQDIDVELSKTALVIVDMQNAFASKGGMLDKLGLFSEKSREIIQPIQKVLKTVRTVGIKIIYLRMVYRPNLSNAGGTESPNYWKETGIVAMREKPGFKGKFITEGTWDSEIIDELKPLPGDIVVNKSRYSGFANTELQTILQTYNIKYLIFVGIATNVCVESTIRDAYFYEYFPILVSDCVAPVGPDYIQKATIFNIEKFFGWVTTSDDLIKSISEKRAK